MSSLKTILVAGATGKQGGALIKSLLASNNPTPQFKIIALTRDANSSKSRSLATQPNVSLLQGNLSSCAAIFSQLNIPLHGVFSIQTPEKPTVEEQQGKDLIDAAVKHGVKHFVYSSVDRGGEKKSEVDPTPIPHFISKFNIEKHLLKVAAGGEMHWTIIRPVAFMENFTPGFAGKGMATMWKLNGEHSKLQLISTKDIGNLAALAFQKLEEFKGKSLSFAGDDLTWKEMDAVFKRVLGTDGAPATYGWVGGALKWVMREQVGIMLDWFGSDGYGADVEECKRLLPGLLNFEEWLRKESAWKTLAK